MSIQLPKAKVGDIAIFSIDKTMNGDKATAMQGLISESYFAEGEGWMYKISGENTRYPENTILVIYSQKMSYNIFTS